MLLFAFNAIAACEELCIVNMLAMSVRKVWAGSASLIALILKYAAFFEKKRATKHTK